MAIRRSGDMLLLRCKKYPSMELRGLFQYLVNQLKRGEGIELVLLQELIQQMANVQFTENLTEDQLDAMAGSETLRYQATSFGVTRNNKALVKSTNRLRDSLLPKDEPRLAIPLLLLVAQHRSVVLIKAEAPYIKMVSEQFDRSHGTLLQYVDFLCSAVTPAVAYAQLIPSLEDLVHMYHLDPEVAFLIYRPVMRLFKCHGADVFWPLDNNEAVTGTEINSDSEPKEDSTGVILDIGSPRKPISWSDLLDTVKAMLPSKAWNSLSPDLYATFWGLTLYDIYVPKNRYESEIVKQHAALKALEENPDNSSSAITKRKKEKERIQEALDRLTSEFRRHEEHVTSVHRRLSCEKDKWLSNCPDTLKINMEFLQRCIFPRCTFSMPDAVYCAMFVHTLHSLGTPFFNTVNHIDVLICKTLQPMICCCTEYEAGRLGKFLYETLKIAYHWKSDESIYERECGNMPGFAVYYRYPNSQRVTYGQFIKVHWKWSQRITRLLIQCLESSEYMEIRNALIMLTKISSVFPVTRKSGINLEKRVGKIKSDDREDLKVLATGVAAALAARKSSWVTDEEFGMGYLDLKPAPAAASKTVAGSMASGEIVSLVNISQNEAVGGRTVALMNQHSDSMNMVKEQGPRMKSDGRLERVENSMHLKSDTKAKGTTAANGPDAQFGHMQAGTTRATENHQQSDETLNRMDENIKVSQRNSSESELKALGKRSLPAGSVSKAQKQDVKDDGKMAKVAGKTSTAPAGDRDAPHAPESRQGGAAAVSSVVTANGKDDGSEFPDGQRPPSRSIHSPRQDSSGLSLKSSDKMPKRTSSAEESDRLSKRRKGEAEPKDSENDVRLSDKERSMDLRSVDFDRAGMEELTSYRVIEKPLDRPKDKGNDRYERDHRERERLDRSEKSRGDDTLAERSRDRSLERHGRERSVERGTDRNLDRAGDKVKDERSKDDRSKLRYSETSTEKSHVDDRFHGQNLPPPPPLPPHMVPQSVSAGGRRDDDCDRRIASSRHTQRLSPRHDDKERRRSEENALVSQDDAKRRREDDIRDRKREERDGSSMKMEERERDREKERDRERAVLLKEEMDVNAAKRRKLKREHLTPTEPGEFSPIAPPPPPVAVGMSQPYDARDRDRKGTLIQRAGYLEEPGMRIHSKEAGNKMARRDVDLIYDRDWDDEKRQRAEQKRRHRK